MPTQADIQRRKTTTNGSQVHNSLVASANTGAASLLTAQANKTTMPGVHAAAQAGKLLQRHYLGSNSQAVNYVPQGQVTGNGANNTVATASTTAQAAQQALIAARAAMAQASAQLQAQQAYVNNLIATAPNSPQLATAQAQLANYQAQLQAATQQLATAQQAANTNPTNVQTAAQTKANKLYTLKDIIARIGAKQAVSVDELAYVIGNEHNALYAWMINNNPNNVNSTLKYTLGIKSLPYAPDKKQMLSQIKLWIKSKNSAALQTVLTNFVFNPNATNWTTNAQLVSYLKTYLNF